MRPTLVRRTWNTVIGLELHVQFLASSKLFSRSPTDWEAEPNTNISLFDVGYPGTLPTISPEVVKQGLSTALALNCEIPAMSNFDRKHYFYHDQPLGYQITQHYHPLARAGYLEIPTKPPKRIRIQQIQLEQDTAKTATAGGKVLIDYNRAGTGLMEIVTEADLSSAEEAALFLKTMRGVLRRIGASGADMEKGSLRVDCNLSIHQEGEPRGDRVELKNLAVINQMQKAISFEVARHRRILAEGGQVETETRAFDMASGETRPLRSKEEVKDYRYIPDGNLPVLRPDPAYLAQLKADLPELPYAATLRLAAQYPGLTPDDASALVALAPQTLDAVAFFESAVACLQAGKPRAAANWIVYYVAVALTKEGLGWGEGVTAAEVAELVDLVEERKVTHASGQKLVLLLASSPPSQTSRLPSLISLHSLAAPPPNAFDLPALLASTFAALPKVVDNITSGRKPTDVNKLVGAVMKATGGKADAREVMRRVKEALGVDG